MKTKLFLVFLILSAGIINSCKKEASKSSAQTLTNEQLDDVSSNTQEVFSDIQSFIFEGLSEALEAGNVYQMPPQTTSSAKTELSKIIHLKSANGGGDGWFGPDANGWYIKSWKSLGYTYTEKIRCQDTVLTSIFSIEYSGGDGSYSNVWENQYTRYTKNKKVLWKGYSDWKISTFGNNDISDVQWRFEFNDWNPETGAGVYDWYWGAHSLGGGYEPYHRVLNIIATEKGAGILNPDDYLLHVKITWYDGSQELWEFEYDTEWSPVEMPENPCKSDNSIIGIN